MTIASQQSLSGPYLCNGVTKEFDYRFKVFDAAHLRVLVHGADGAPVVARNNIDYSVTGVGNDNGGKVVMNIAPGAGKQLTITRDVPFVQETDLENQGAFFLEVVERAFDDAVIRDQQLKEGLGRAVMVGENVDFSGKDKLVRDITKLAKQSGDISTVVGIAGNINTVASIAGHVTTVAGFDAPAIIAAHEYAHQWAVKAENSAVNDGKNPVGFSAYHWARKAAASAAAASAAAGFNPDEYLKKTGGIMMGGINSRAVSPLRFSGGDVQAPAAILHKNAQDFVLLLTDANDRDGMWNSLRPFMVKLDTGEVRMGCGLSVTAGDVSFSGTLKAHGEIQGRAVNAMRLVGYSNSPSVILRKDANNFYFLLSDADKPYGTFNDFRPLHINLATGKVGMNEGLNVQGGINILSNRLYVGTSQHHEDGNIYGEIWKNWHPSGWLSAAIDAKITARLAAHSSGILDVRLAGTATAASYNTIGMLPASYVAVGVRRGSYNEGSTNDPSYVSYIEIHGKQLQVNVPGVGWRAVASV